MSEIKMATLFVFLFFAVLQARGSGEQCIEGKYHKTAPSAETQQYHHCQPWKKLTCCKAEFTKELAINETRNLYNHSWHRCGQLSPACLSFWFEQECFYQCSPYVYQWKSPTIPGAIEGVPICSDYCDKWYDACKNDKICVTDVLTGYNYSIHGENFCPKNELCTTYAQRFGSGEGLCMKMWNSSYTYKKPNLDRSNCMDMWFNGSNPNANVKRESDPTGQATMIRVLPLLWAFVIGAIASAAVMN